MCRKTQIIRDKRYIKDMDQLGIQEEITQDRRENAK